MNFSALQPGDPAGVDHLPRRGRDLQDLRAHRVPRALRVGQGPAAQAAPGGCLWAEQRGQGRGDWGGNNQVEAEGGAEKAVW